MKPRTLVLLGSLALLLAAKLALADTSHCIAITAVPITLSDNGVYCLTQDLTLSGTTTAAVFINADSVTLDLNGHALRSNAAANMSSTAVAVVGHRYFTITDGTIAGFAQPIYVAANGSTTAKGGLISELKIQRSYDVGIAVTCDGCVIRDNMVTDTITPAGFTGYAANGISVAGTGNQVTGNRVFNTFPLTGAPALGIVVTASNSTVSGNYVSNDHLTSDNIYGFYITGSGALVSANQAQGVAAGFGLGGSNLKYRDNLSNGCTTAFSGASVGGVHDLGGNN